MPSYQTVLHWFRKDLRLTDNTALQQAAADAKQVIPVYVLSDWKTQHQWTGPNRQHFLCGCLESLAKNLESIHARLICRCGETLTELEKLLRETAADAIYFNHDYDPFGRQMEQKLRVLCHQLGIGCHGFKDRVLHEPSEVLTGGGTDYRVYTPYSRNWLGLPKIAPRGRLTELGPAAAPTIPSHPLPTVAHWDLPAPTATLLPAGERAARDRMKEFIDSGLLAAYAQNRNLPAGQTTSRLGQDLRFGLISIRELFAHCQAAAAETSSSVARGSIETYIKELAWREFYLAVLWFHPEVFEAEFNADWRGLPWPGSDEHFQLWSQGRTGFPIVDAGIRELLTTGFMHNRVRMIVSMFLTKDLHCDWRLGESFFMQQLVDGENASNNGGWQWSAGTGADAAPYFRIQNPWTQTKSYDPDGRYIRQWVPELRQVSAERFLAPPKDGRPLAAGYPLPIIDHSTERDRTLALFKKHRAG
jgi:deoxyribodipyrimidine photo-lyase